MTENTWKDHYTPESQVLRRLRLLFHKHFPPDPPNHPLLKSRCALGGAPRSPGLLGRACCLPPTTNFLYLFLLPFPSQLFFLCHFSPRPARSQYGLSLLPLLFAFCLLHPACISASEESGVADYPSLGPGPGVDQGLHDMK